MKDKFEYGSVYINEEGRVRVDGAGLEDSREIIFFADGLNRGWGSALEKTEIHGTLEESLEFGNPRQIKALKAYQVLVIQK